MKWLVTSEKKNENKYLVLDEIDENKEVLNKYEEVRKCIKKEIEKIMVAKKMNMGKIFLKNRFDFNDDLPANRQ